MKPRQGKRARVCHLTSVHPFPDTRIFHKECCSLAAGGFETHLVMPGARQGVEKGVHLHGILDAGPGRLARMTSMAYRVFRVARAIDAHLYHLHDPELLPIGILLGRRGKRVVYDVHEDVPEDILTKEWLPSALRRVVALFFKAFENSVAKHLSFVVAATPAIRDRFLRQGCRAVDINNYPICDDLFVPGQDWSKKAPAACYAGLICRIRGIFEMLRAIDQTDAGLFLAGRFSPTSLRQAVSMMPGWRKVSELGHLDRAAMAGTLAKSAAGLLLFHPVPNHVHAQPNKMFEYMSAGIPVIASNFPLWREIIEVNRCGLCVDPLNPTEIAAAIRWTVEHPEEARRMGENGRASVTRQYNWENERAKLLALYEVLLG